SANRWRVRPKRELTPWDVADGVRDHSVNLDTGEPGQAPLHDARTLHATGKEKERSMAITLNHTIVPARDKEASARFFAEIFGLKYEGPSGHFAPVHINETLTLDFDDDDCFDTHHYAFHVSDPEF